MTRTLAEKHEYDRRWRLANPDRVRERNRRWHEAHPRPYLAYRYMMLQAIQAGGWDRVMGDEEPRCAGCGCDDWELLEVNHRNGGGSRDLQGLHEKGGLTRQVFNGHRAVDDLDLRCRPCNAVDYLIRLWPGKTRFPKVVWAPESYREGGA